MSATDRIGITRQDYIRLQNELAGLHLAHIIEKRDCTMDYSANRTARASAPRARIRKVKDLLANAVVDQDAVGDVIAEPGTVCTIRYDDTGDTETFLLGRYGAPADAQMTVYSLASPLGRSIVGARSGEQRIYAIPHERGRIVTLLQAVPYDKHVAERCKSSTPTWAMLSRHERN